MVLPSELTFRLRGCPAVDEPAIRARLSHAFGDIAPNDIRIHSLAKALDPLGTPTKTATLTFAKLPSLIKTQIEKGEWSIGDSDGRLILDTHFLGLTPLNDAGARHEFDCIAISGLASHPFGSWQPKGDRTWMWVRDALPKALPHIRAILFGYDTTLVKSNSFQTPADLASFLIGNINASGLAIKPLIFLAHSLGGIVLKEALVTLASGGAHERQILRQVVGAVLFGVPSRGMEVHALMTMVSGQVNEGLVRNLMADSDYLRSLDDRFFGIAQLGQMELFWAYETKTTSTVATQGDGSYVRTGPAKVLVDPESATRGIYKTNAAKIVAINESHSDMVKFREADPNCQVVLGKLMEICAHEAAVSYPPKLRKIDNERYFVVPFGRNKGFVGRRSILQEVLERVPPTANKDDCQRTVIEGLGGVGKTQIALEAVYCIRETDPECSVFWVPAVNAISFEQAYREIGRKLRVSGIEEDNADVKSLVRAALSHHESAGRWLMVVDNVDDTELLCAPDNAGPSLAEYIPFNRDGSVLFTTRNHKAATTLTDSESIIIVEEMTKEDSLKLMSKNVKEHQLHNLEDTMKLLELLTYLPLAIRQASAYMAKEQVSTTTYLEFCQSSNKEMIDMLSQDFEDRHRYKEILNPVATTWLLSFNQISRNPLAASYLKFMCFLTETDIPQSLLPPAGKREATEAIGTLKAYAFITQREDSFDLHRLVRLAMQNWIGKEEKELEKHVASVLQQLAKVFPSPKHENKEIWQRYLPHAKNALEFRNKSSLDEEARGYLLSHMGACYSILGKYQLAERISLQAVEVMQKVLGTKHPYTLASMHHLADVLVGLGRYEEAEVMHRQILKLSQKVQGTDHPDTLNNSNKLSSVLASLGRYKEAETICRQTLEIRQKVLGLEHPDTLSSMSTLADMLQSLGRYKEAEAMHRQTLKLRQKVLGTENPETLTSTNNLANVLESLGRYKEAESIHRQTLELRQKIQGPKHPWTLTSMDNLASVLKSLGRYKEAEAMYQQTLEVRQKVLGTEHPDTLCCMNNLAIALKGLGRYKETEAMHRQTLELRRKVLGTEHPDTLSSMNNLASVLTSLRRYKEAEVMGRQTVELRQRVIGSEHPKTLISMNNFAIMLESQGRYKEAEGMHRQTLELRQKVLGAEHPDAVRSVNNLALLLERLERHKEADVPADPRAQAEGAGHYASQPSLSEPPAELVLQQAEDACIHVGVASKDA